MTKSQSRRSAQNGNSKALTLRWSLLIGGGALALYAARHRSKSGMALGGLLVYGGSKVPSRPQHFRAEASFTLNCSVEEAYRFWRNFENLPLFMRHLDSVRNVEDGRTEWVAIGPLDSRLRWKAEIVDEEENQRIAWRSLAGSDFHNRGSVEFRPASGNRGVVVTAVMEYEPPAGALGRAAAAVFGKHPEFTVREDLRRFKALMEMGEIPTTEGQSHGPRSAVISAMHTVYPEKRKPTEFKASEQFAEQRRAS